MKLQNFTAWDDGTKSVTRVNFVVANHPDPSKQTESIAVQVSLDAPIVRNGAILRAEALEKARGILDGLIADYERLAEQARKGDFPPQR